MQCYVVSAKHFQCSKRFRWRSTQQGCLPELVSHAKNFVQRAYTGGTHAYRSETARPVNCTRLIFSALKRSSCAIDSHMRILRPCSAAYGWYVRTHCTRRRSSLPLKRTRRGASIPAPAAAVAQCDATLIGACMSWLRHHRVCVASISNCTHVPVSMDATVPGAAAVMRTSPSITVDAAVDGAAPGPPP